MVNVLLGILVVALGIVALFMTGVLGDSGSSGPGRYLKGLIGRKRERTNPIRVEVGGLHCRVLLTRGMEKGRSKETLGIEICGKIRGAANGDKARVRISLGDITDGEDAPVPVYSRLKKSRQISSVDFVHEGELGTLPSSEMVLSDWMTVAQIEAGWLIFANKGDRILRVSVSVISSNSGATLGHTECDFNYHNNAVGYLELEDNIQRAKMLAVTLAFAVSAADSKLYDCEVEVIRNWALTNVEAEQVSERVRMKIEKALDKTVEFFQSGNQVEIDKICRQIVETTPIAERYDILDLCMRVVEANGAASAAEIDLLGRLAQWLDVDAERFRAMMEKILPVNLYEYEDEEAALGLSADMNPEEARKRLNDEYRKWNARVTSPDPEVQRQADQMLKLIADARKRYLMQEV